MFFFKNERYQENEKKFKAFYYSENHKTCFILSLTNEENPPFICILNMRHSARSNISNFILDLHLSLNFPEVKQRKKEKKSFRQLDIIRFYCLHKQFAI